MRMSGSTFIRYAQCQNILKPNNLKIFARKKTKSPKQNSQHRLMSHIAEEEEP
jgi:hypothetical protein